MARCVLSTQVMKRDAVWYFGTGFNKTKDSRKTPQNCHKLKHFKLFFMSFLTRQAVRVAFSTN